MKMRNGFTAIELMVSLVIVTILVTIAVPFFSNLIASQKLKSVTLTFTQQINLMRSEAVRSHSDINLVLSTGNSWCYGFTKNSTCNCNVTNDCSLGSISSADFPNVSLATSGITGNKLTINGTRGLLSTGGTLTFAASSKNMQVVLNQMGNANICSNLIPGYSPC
jgi:type IV fimbrial biogenesis protein FimT